MKNSSFPHLIPEQARETFYSELPRVLAKRFKECDAVTLYLVFNLVHTFYRWEERISRRLQKAGMSVPGLNVLGLLDGAPGQQRPLHELSELLLVTRANVTGLVDSLVRKGYVQRVEHPDDRRSRLAKLTAVGRRWLHGYLPGHFRAITEMTKGLSARDKKIMATLLQKWRCSIEPAGN